MLPSASSLDRVAECPGSAVLPQTKETNPYQRHGNVVHHFLRRVPEIGVEAALAEVPGDHRDACAAIDLSNLPPCEPGAYACEVAFAVDIYTGTARELGRGLSRDEAYALKTPQEWVGTADVVGLTEDAVIVYDYKTGWGEQVPASRHRQLRFYGYAAARTYGRQRAIVALIRIPEGALVPWFDRAELDAFELDSVEAELHHLTEVIEFEKQVVLTGGMPTVVAGPHCRYCPAFMSCPAKISLAKAIGEPAAELELLPTLTRETAAAAWHRIAAVEEVLRQVKTALKDLAREEPIPLGDGYVLGAVPEEKIEPDVAAKVLAEVYGPHVAEAALERDPKMTKTALKKALQTHVLKPGMKITKLVETALDAIREAKGITVKHSIERYKPR